eukprot:scaffold30729_cov111-Isochrysis_galbana.AAC.3
MFVEALRTAIRTDLHCNGDDADCTLTALGWSTWPSKECTESQDHVAYPRACGCRQAQRAVHCTKAGTHLIVGHAARWGGLGVGWEGLGRLGCACGCFICGVGWTMNKCRERNAASEQNGMAMGHWAGGEHMLLLRVLAAERIAGAVGERKTSE